MPVIRKTKLITIFFCILFLGGTSITLAQEIKGEILISLTTEGREYLAKGDINNASKKIQEAYDKATKLKSSLSSEISNNLSEALFKMGEAVFNKDGAKSAKKWLDRSIEVNNRNDDAYLLLARICYEGKDYNTAISAVNTANNITVKANNFLLLAFTYLHTKSYQKAIEACNAGLKSRPTNKEASALLNMRGLVYNALGDQDHAKKDYLDASKKDSGNKAAKNNYENLKKLES